ncbi:MAG: hypothetical protein K6E40_14440 [Desulfovibrio sp.]|nr:hypothetical protein [Desulfovibrio sp.]
MAELYEISFALEAHRRAIADAVAGAVQARDVQAGQERHESRERRAFRQDRHVDVLKQARQPDARTAGAKATGHVFWT